MKPGRVEIAGAGIAGLAAAIALGRRGWRVRVHERHPSLRLQGYGITLFGNGLRVLRALGAAEAALEGAVVIGGLENFAANGELMGRQVLGKRGKGGLARRLARPGLLEALADQARDAGAEILFGSEIADADPAGALITTDGRRHEADLVLGTDGSGSKLRERLGLLERIIWLDEGANRILLPRQKGDFEGEKGGFVQEWWHGGRRMLFSAVSPTQVYVTWVCRAGDEAGRRVPIDVESWSATFPPMRPVIERIARDADWSMVHWEQFRVVRLKRWSTGRVALLGDAAHGMPPNIGQGGGCALMNALALAVALETAPDLETGLRLWEARERPLTDHTQRWSLFYSRVTHWPRPLQKLALGPFSAIGWVNRQIHRTASHVPTGTEALPAAPEAA